jgi:hypothetical protein
MFDDQEVKPVQMQPDVSQELPPGAPRENPIQTIPQMDAFIQTLMEKRAAAEEIKRELTERNKEIASMETQLVAAMKQFERSNYKSKFGTVTIQQRWRVNVPTDEAQKKALFQYLKEKGILWRYATVQSNSLNSFYMEEWENAKQEGNGLDYEMPGVGPAKLFEQLSIRKG